MNITITIVALVWTTIVYGTGYVVGRLHQASVTSGAAYDAQEDDDEREPETDHDAVAMRLLTGW